MERAGTTTTTMATSPSSHSCESDGGRRRLRIAMVCDFFYPRLGGVENHIWSLSQHLVKLGHKVVVITHAYGKGRTGVRYLPGPVKAYYCPIREMVDQDALPTFTATLPLVRWILIREGVDVVHAHQATSTMANESLAYAAAMGLASVYTDHSLFGFDDVAGVVLNRVLQVTLSQIDYAICVSHTCRDNLILRAKVRRRDDDGEGGKDGGSKVKVIPNAIDPTKFTPGPAGDSKNPSKSDGGEDDGRLKIVIISRLVYRKGVDLLVGIIPNVCRCFDDVDFIVGGDGSKMLPLQEMVERERLQDRVEFLGSVPHSDVRDVLVRGHVFLNCSLTESFCIAILEAAACGLLVVSTNVGGVPEVLPDDMILLSPPTVPDLVNNVKCAIGKYRRKQQKQKQPDDDVVDDDDDSVQLLLDPWEAHRRVAQMYSWRRVAVETSQIYHLAIQKPRRPFSKRLRTYYRSVDGGISGAVVCALAVVLQIWLRFVEWWQPRHAIDVVPDICAGTRRRTPDDGGG